jgi:enolase
MSKIDLIKAREILNSRGNPTIEVDIILDNGILGRASVPSGASKGNKEALELIDNDKNRCNGLGVLNAVQNVNNIIAKELKNLDITNQKQIDDILINLDGTENKSKLGANAILGVSIAAAKASASLQKIPLYKYLSTLISHSDNFKYTPPIPMLNVINGGMHADNKLCIQEFMLVPIGYDNFKSAIIASAEIIYKLKAILKEKKYNVNVGDEGGFAPNLNSTEEVLSLLNQAIGDKKHKVKIALDVAASTFYDNKLYNIENKTLSSDELIKFYEYLVDKYEIISIEDPLEEDDKIGWKKITEILGKKIKIVGDDIFVTNPKIFLDGIKNNLANSILIKMNQIGTITETIKTINIAKSNNYSVIISHRSGETEDTTIAHLAVACGENTMIKSGSLARSERVAKYNEIIRIEENII